MNRTIQFGDRRPLEPRMDYCRLDYEFNRDAVDTLDLTIQIFDQRQTQFLQRYADLTPAQADALIQQALGSGWTTVLTQRFQDWAVCYVQRSKSTAQPQILDSQADFPQTPVACATASTSSSHRLRGRNPVRGSVWTAQSRQARPHSLRRPLQQKRHILFSWPSSFWQNARTIGTRVAAVGLATGAIALGLTNTQVRESLDTERIFASLERRLQRSQGGDSLNNESIRAEASGQLLPSVALPITPVDEFQADPFRQAVMLAEQAVLEGRVADSAADWKDLALQWHEAARLMKQVPTSDERYAIAQNRADAYSNQREQSLIETALHSVVFPIENRQRVSDAGSSPEDSSEDSSAQASSSPADISPMSRGGQPQESDAATSAGSSSASSIPTDSAMVSTTPACQSTFNAMIQPIVSAPAYRGGQWGIYAQSLSSGQVLYQLNGDDFFVPASNIKLYTTAAAVTWVEQAQKQLQATPATTSSEVANAVTTPAMIPTHASPLAGKLVPSLTDLKSEFPILIQNANLYSNNWSAEILLEKMGGPTAVKEVLDQVGIDPIGYHQADGSGLSRSNLVTPQSLVETLAVMHNVAGAETFFGTLPISGQRGTLKNRFHNTAAYGKVRAKTGTLLGVRSLSGYLDHSIHGRVAFGIVVNYPGHTGYGLNSPIDQIVVQMMQLGECSGNFDSSS